MAALQHLAPEFIKEGRLCWLRSPLYIVHSPKKNYYYYNDKEYNDIKGKIKGETKRCKGLGTLEPEEARESMFTDEFQRLDVLEWEEGAIDLLYDLMGIDVAPRTEFIFNNVDFSEIKE